MTATPMKNRADDIIELINFIRPPNGQVARDQIYSGKTVHQVEFKPEGRDLLRKMCRGYVSFLRGADPITFAERVDMGTIPPGLSFTKVIRCHMLPFQLDAYNVIVDMEGDSLNRKSTSVANFAFPGFPKGKNAPSNNLIGYSGPSGINEIRNQLRSNADLLCKRIADTVLSEYKITDPSSLMYLTDDKTVSGDIFSEKYLKHFSVKFHTALQNINDVVNGKKGEGLIFVYSNLVKVGVQLFQEILLHNGYLVYQESSSNYNIKNNTRCYFCGVPRGDHDTNTAAPHKFRPATFLLVTGRSEENMDDIPEEQLEIIYKVFNHKDNRDGRNIKILLGSKVMNEGITLYQIKETHILDVHYNLQKVDQAIGRSIRWCVHYHIMTESNPYPKVEIYKYVVSLDKGLSSEEELYRKAENKYMVVKETERILQEESIDCPLNRNNNIFLEELAKFEGCGSVEKPCPAICGYMPCDYKCGDKLLNAKYYDPERNIYKKVEKENMDYSTYNLSLAREEINYAKERIKEMYKLESAYKLDDIIDYVKKSFALEKQDQFDVFYVYQALDDLVPVTVNQHNNFVDTVVNKLNQPGYLIYRNIYYIFNPYDKSEDEPMDARVNPEKIIPNIVYVDKYIMNKGDYQEYEKDIETEEVNIPVIAEKKYDYEAGLEYYENRDDYDFVGVIDQPTLKNIQSTQGNDVFKIRERRQKVDVKKRQSGNPSFKGSVCANSKEKDYLLNVLEKIRGKLSDTERRNIICDNIQERLFDLEKYSTSKQKNKMNYLIVPTNHPTIPFPLNLEDRIKNILSDIQKKTRLATTDSKINVHVIKDKALKKYSDISYVTYEIIFNKSFSKFTSVLKEYGAIEDGSNWKIIVA